MRGQGKETEGFLIAILAFTGILAGGYFLYAAALCSVFLWMALFWMIKRNKKLTIAWDSNMLAFTVMAAGYLITALWAVDSGMALMGFVKFVPALLYFVILCQSGGRQEEIIAFLPLLGSVMTIFSFVMMQFPAFEEWVSVAGRLSGFFQYPNTYALFMLVCLITTVYRLGGEDPDWLDIVYAAIEIFGIFMSGSRTVFVLTAGTVLFLAVRKKEVRRIILPIFLTGILAAAVLFVTGIGNHSFSRFISAAAQSSTLLGRLLYVKDAIPLMLRHSFGIGYYGYYYMQQEIQTGVYSVVNIHNEFFQYVLDIGIIPAVLIYGSIVKSILSSHNPDRNRIVLTVIALHSLFDYDFQFLCILFILQLFLEIRKEREITPTGFSKGILVTVGGFSILLAVGAGMSDFFYTRGNYEKSLRYYSGNTLAETALLTEVKDMEEMKKHADAVIARNRHVAVAYSAKGRACFAEGDVENFMKNKLTAIELAPYQYDEYLDYLDVLLLSVVEYLKTGDDKSAESALKRAKEVPKMLKEVEKKTSRFGWEIRDTPQVTLPHEYIRLLEETEAQVNE